MSEKHTSIVISQKPRKKLLKRQIIDNTLKWETSEHCPSKLINFLHVKKYIKTLTSNDAI